MQLCRVRLKSGEIRVGIREGERVALLDRSTTLADVLHAGQPARRARESVAKEAAVPLAEVRLLAPVEGQEVWAAGVTYRRSKEERERESVGAARFFFTGAPAAFGAGRGGPPSWSSQVYVPPGSRSALVSSSTLTHSLA